MFECNSTYIVSSLFTFRIWLLYTVQRWAAGNCLAATETRDIKNKSQEKQNFTLHCRLARRASAVENYDNTASPITSAALDVAATSLPYRNAVQKDSWSQTQNLWRTCFREWWESNSPPEARLDVESVFSFRGIHRIRLSVCRQGRFLIRFSVWLSSVLTFPQSLTFYVLF